MDVKQLARELVADWAPLTQEQKADIAGLLRPAIEALRAERSAERRSPSTELLSVDQVAAALGVGRMSAYRRIWDGEIPMVNIGRNGKRARIRVRQCDLEAYVSQRMPAMPPRRRRPVLDVGGVKPAGEDPPRRAGSR